MEEEFSLKIPLEEKLKDRHPETHEQGNRGIINGQSKVIKCSCKVYTYPV